MPREPGKRVPTLQPAPMSDARDQTPSPPLIATGTAQGAVLLQTVRVKARAFVLPL